MYNLERANLIKPSLIYRTDKLITFRLEAPTRVANRESSAMNTLSSPGKTSAKIRNNLDDQLCKHFEKNVRFDCER